MQKPLVFVGQNKDACFYVMIALETDSGPILVPFWEPKSDQNRSQTGFEIDPENDRKKCCVDLYTPLARSRLARSRSQLKVGPTSRHARLAWPGQTKSRSQLEVGPSHGHGQKLKK